MEFQGALDIVIMSHWDPMIIFKGFWVSAGAKSRVVTLTDFIEYVVTPHVANLLIQEDLDYGRKCKCAPPSK